MRNDLADRIRAMLTGEDDVAEIRMFGGVCFTLNGNMMVVARGKGGLLARVGQGGEARALALPDVERMVMRGRQMTGYVTIPDDRLHEEALRDWIALAKSHVQTLPPKKGKSRAVRR